MVTAFAIYNAQGKLLAASSDYTRLFEEAVLLRMKKKSAPASEQPAGADLIPALVASFSGGGAAEQETILLFRGLSLNCKLRRLEAASGQPVFLIEVVYADARDERDSTASRDQAEIGRLTGRLLHDCKNQLSGLKLYAAWLRKRLNAPTAGATGNFSEEVSIIDRLINGLNLVAEQAGYVSKLAQPLHLKKSPADLLLLVRQVADEMQAQAAARKVMIVVESEPDLPHFSCDALLLVTALKSLVSRAVTVSQQQVSIGLQQTRQELLIAVADDGAETLTPAQCAAFFEFPAEEKLTTAVLGLTLADRIIEQHGGRAVTTPNSPSGTIVTIRLGLQRSVAA